MIANGKITKHSTVPYVSKIITKNKTFPLNENLACTNCEIYESTYLNLDMCKYELLNYC